MRATAFVAHPDCPRHDTGWRHPDHQGRLPAIVRAVHRDMLTLHEHLLEVAADPATPHDLFRVHSEGHVRHIREASARAARAGRPVGGPEDLVLSGASWEAALAAAGTVLTGVRTVTEGWAGNAFCLARPEGRGAEAEAAGRFSAFNNVAIAASVLAERNGEDPVLVVDWAARPGAWGAIPALAAANVVAVAPGGPRTDPGATVEILAEAVQGSLGTAPAAFVLLSASFEDLEGDPVGEGALSPTDFHRLTTYVRELAEERADGRLVSSLEGGYDAPLTARSVVQHLRALAGLPAA